MHLSRAAPAQPTRAAAGTRAIAWLMLAVAVSACAPPAGPDIAERRTLVTDALPAMKTFRAAAMPRPQRSNVEIAHDFLELSFRMESGRTLPVLTRFERPVTVRLTGAVPPTAGRDLDHLLARLRAEAGVDVRRVPADTDAGVTVEFISRATLQRQVPQAACFVVPRVDSWRAFRGARRTGALDWTTLAERVKTAVFIPADTSPQEVRDCLHEEVAQAMGPLNDLYRLSDSVFNDDNFHTVLTGFDMLVMQTYYAPELRSGMTREEVAARLPAILRRLNPGGERPAGPLPARSPREWTNAIEAALGPRGENTTRRAAAAHAVAIARREGWQDARLGFSYFAFARLALAHETERAFEAFQRAAAIYRGLPGTAVHLAHIDMQMAAFALSARQPERALDLTGRSMMAVAEAENAALLATLLMLRAEALEMLGRPAEAKAVRLDSLAWARYGFGAEDKVRARLSEIAILSPLRREAGLDLGAE